MEKVLVFGHINPDTDSVTASITLANLKRKMGLNAEERVLGDINKESKFVLDYFNVKEPRYLNDTKLRLKIWTIERIVLLMSIHLLWKLMSL